MPHGGYITSVFQSVARLHFETTLKKWNQPHTMALGLNFLRRTEVGPALFTVKEVKLGRQTSVVHITLTQSIRGDIREEVIGYITQSNLEKEQGKTLNTEWTLHPSAPSVDLRKLDSGEDEHWAEVLSLPHASFRKASNQVIFSFPRQGQLVRGAVDEWIRLRTSDASERFTNETLGYVSDMWPQMIEGMTVEDLYTPGKITKEKAKQAAGFWYPTVLLNLDIKKPLPKEGVEWLFVRARAKQVKNGRFDLEVTIMDETGDLVALSNHVCLILDASRNLAKRSTKL